MVAHALGIIKNRLFGGSVNADRAAVMALYHDSSEVLTGDLPTPVKYFNPEIARDLCYSTSTIRNDLSTIYTKLGVGGRPEAAARAIELGLV